MKATPYVIASLPEQSYRNADEQPKPHRSYSTKP